MTVRMLHVNAGNMYGGIETMLVTLARARLEVPALEQEFAVAFEGRFADELRDAGARVHVLGAVRASRPWTIIPARRRLRSVLAGSRFDALAVHGSWSHAIFAAVISGSAEPPHLVHWAHAPPTGRHWLERWAACTPPRLVIANSRFTEAAIHSVFPAAALAVIHPPAPPAVRLDTDARATFRRELGASPEDVVVLFVGRLERTKGAHVLVAALGELAAVPGWRAWIVGGPQRSDEQPYLAELRSAAERAGIAAAVAFLGERRDVARLMATADVYCQPNVGPESFGITFIEALRAGLPVITTPLGGAPEILGEHGAVFTPPDAVAVSAALRSLVGDPAERERLRAESLARGDRFDGAPATLRSVLELLAALSGRSTEAAA
jgi:glycosyltransferase involved in cell wall biosynthesis